MQVVTKTSAGAKTMPAAVTSIEEAKQIKRPNRCTARRTLTWASARAI